MAARLITADTSVVIPLLLEAHAVHTEVAIAARDVRRIPAHVLLEAIAVFTRLPGGLAVGSDQAVRVLTARFPEEPLAMRGADYTRLAAGIAVHRPRGGQVYDALVAATVKQVDAVLLTRDRRAEPTYRALGVESRYLD